MERTVTLFENGKPIFGLKRHIDTRNNNLEEQLADFIMQLGNGKGMLEPMRVANRIRIMCNRHSAIDVLGMIAHPNEWRINQHRALPEEEVLKIEEKQEKTRQALEAGRV